MYIYRRSIFVQATLIGVGPLIEGIGCFGFAILFPRKYLSVASLGKGTKNSSTSLWRRAMMQILGRSAGSDRVSTVFFSQKLLLVSCCPSCRILHQVCQVRRRRSQLAFYRKRISSFGNSCRWIQTVQSAASYRFMCTIRALSCRVETRQVLKQCILQTTSKDTPTNTTETRTQMDKTNDSKATYKLTFCKSCFVPSK